MVGIIHFIHFLTPQGTLCRPGPLPGDVPVTEKREYVTCPACKREFELVDSTRAVLRSAATAEQWTDTVLRLEVTEPVIHTVMTAYRRGVVSYQQALEIAVVALAGQEAAYRDAELKRLQNETDTPLARSTGEGQS